LRRFAPLLPIAFVLANCVTPAESISVAPFDEHAQAIEKSGFADPKPVTVLEAQKPKASDGPFILVVLDGARWQEVFGGADPAMGAPRGFDTTKYGSPEKLLPNLTALVGRGLAIGAPGHGEPFLASGPNYVSLPGYMELFTGARTDCQSNSCARTRRKTIVDEVRDSLAASNDDVAVVASWPPIELAATADPSRVVMSNGVHHTSNAGSLRFDGASSMLFWNSEQAFPFPGDGDYRPDELTARIAIPYFAKKQPRLLILGLGDMDEYAHKNDYRDYILAMQAADKTIGQVTRIADAMAARGKKPTIVVTADHGRADDFRTHGADSPESARTWLVMAGGNVPQKGLVDTKATHYLRDVVPTMRVLMGLPSRGGHGAGDPIPEVVD
jgi:hypothetical protein